MSTSRRDFLKSTVIAGAGMAVPGTASAAITQPSQAQTAPVHRNTAATSASSGEYTRGIGLYPGASSENFSPTLAIDSTTYRNLALRRPAYHSSSYDYNLTAQLVTDGIKDTQMPTWIGMSFDRLGMLPKTEREVLVDHFPASIVPLKSSAPSIQIQLGGDRLPSIDRLAIFVVVPEQVSGEMLQFTASVSDDGRLWKEVGKVLGGQTVSPDTFPPDLSQRAKLYFPSIPLSQVYRSRYYEVKCELIRSLPEDVEMQWAAGQIEFYEGEKRVQIGGPYTFTSAWMSAGSGEEWVYVDLGARCEFDRITLSWIARAAEGSIQVSDNAHDWHNLHPLSGSGLIDDIRLTPAAHGRYVRVLMTRPSSPDGYILSEVEIFGRGGPVAKPKPAAVRDADGRLNLAGGAWRLHRLDPTGVSGENLSKPGYKDSDWVIATVPGTVLTSYVNAGALPDPNFGQNQLYISDSYFYADFWYRTEFQSSQPAAGKRVWLNFDGINWKADVFLNGAKIGRIEGGFLRGQFDVTDKLVAGTNALAVRIEKNATPGSAKQKTYENPSRNGGALGADNPTYHASIGWDWIPTIRGRNTGIWGDVYLTETGAVSIDNPLVTSALPLPDISRADVSIEVDLTNNTSAPVTGTLRGRFGDARFKQSVSLDASQSKSVKLDPSAQPALRIQNPQLWWPVGYGDPHLYDVELSFEIEPGKSSDKKSFKAGIRQMTYSEDGDALRIWINGRRFIAKGGNWGFGESMLLYRAREYDAAVRYHREMNFTMVRNWVGQIGDDAFYEACDCHGVMVWQDFWLANPWDGPIPDDNAMFLNNARDLVKRIRRHASIGIYCGRNEGFPPPPLEKGIRSLLAELHPDLHYIGSSADNVVSGHGPYNALPPSLYFRVADSKLHSEIGMPNIPPIESVRVMMPESAIWPQGLEWGLHDFSMEGAQGGRSFVALIKDSFGGANSGEEWVSLAQFLNYEGYRAMFESQSKYRMGVLLWMSHPCWPSFVWQTYDYYFEPTAAYFGAKKGSEPLHIQWNRTTESIEVVNYSAGNARGLTAQAEILNMDGAKKWSKTAAVDAPEDSTAACITVDPPGGLSPVHFLRLTLTRGSEVLSSNFYLRSLQEGDYRAIRQLPAVELSTQTKVVREGDRWILTTDLSNPSVTPALMTRLKVVRDRTGDRILPAIYSDNYIALMPGERRSIVTELHHADTRGEKPRIIVSGFNVHPA